MSDTDQDSPNLPSEEGPSPSADTPRAEGEEKNSPVTSVAELARLAQRAFDGRRWGECRTLTRAIHEIDPNHKGAHEIESWIRSELEANLLNARALLDETHPRVQEERAQFLLSRILSVDSEHPEANALLLEVASRISASDAGFAAPRTGNGQKTAPFAPPPSFAPPPPSFAERLPPERPRNAPPSPRPGSLFADALPEGGPYPGHGVWKPKKSKKSLAVGMVSVVVAIAVVLGAIRFQPQLVEILSDLRTEAPAGAADGSSPGVAPPSPEQPLPEEIAAASRPAADSARLDLVVIPGTGVDVSVDGGPYQPVPSFLDLAPGSHTLEFRADGFEPHATSAEVSAGERRVAAVVLDPSVPGAGSGDFAGSGTDPGTAPTPPPAAVDSPAVRPPPAAVDSPAPEVTLHINARPWAQVFLDGPAMQPLGQTPLGNVRVPAGSVLVFRNPGFPEKTYVVEATDETIQMAFP
jgi:hypothetical protein